MIEVSYFLLFIAIMTSLITYAIIPRVPVIALVSTASVMLAGGVWWHWMQFAVDYRNNTWMEQLRNYSAYVMVFFVILLSYGYYTFAIGSSSSSSANEGSLSASLSKSANAVMEQGQEIGSSIMEAPGAVLETLGNLLEEAPKANGNVGANASANRNGNGNGNRNRNRNRNNNFLI